MPDGDHEEMAHDLLSRISQSVLAMQDRLDRDHEESRLRLAQACVDLDPRARAVLQSIAEPARVCTSFEVACTIELERHRDLGFGLAMKPLGLAYARSFGLSTGNRSTLSMKVSRISIDEAQEQEDERK